MAYSNEEALYLFIDGELEPAAEEALFAELAYNEGLRSEMKDLLFMRNAATRDDLAAPLYVKDKLLAAVGLAATVAGSGSGAGLIALSETAQKIAPWWESLWIKIATPLLAAMTGAFVMWTLTDNPTTTTASLTPSTAPPASFIQKEQGSNSVASSSGVTGITTSVSIPERKPEQYPVATQSNTLSDLKQRYQTLLMRNTQLETRLHQEISLRVAADSAVAAIQQSASSTSIANSTAESRENTYTDNSSLLPIYPAPLLYSDKQFLVFNSSPVYLSGRDNSPAWDASGHTGVRLRGISSQSLTSTTLEPQSSSIADNAHIAMMYHLTSGFALGVEVGREAFVQNFQGRINNRLSRIEQYPELWNVGIMANYHIWDIVLLNNTALMGESFIGGAVNGGPIGRQTLGIRYDLSEGISLMGGMQFSAMFFQFQKEWFSTFKYGVTYGIQYNF